MAFIMETQLDISRVSDVIEDIFTGVARHLANCAITVTDLIILLFVVFEKGAQTFTIMINFLHVLVIVMIFLLVVINMFP